jgi:hypothetical protein
MKKCDNRFGIFTKMIIKLFLNDIISSETSYELRELESKLRAAYVQKERTAQMAEKEAIKFDSYLEDAEIVRRMRSETDKAEEDRRQREIIRQQEMIRYKQELERQLEEREIGKQKAYEEFLREKLVIDEIVRKIYEEDQRYVYIVLSI